MKTQMMYPTKIVTTDRQGSSLSASDLSLSEMKPLAHGFYHGVIGLIVMGFLLTSCASMSCDLPTSAQTATTSEVAAETSAHVIQMDEVQVWNPIDRSQFVSNRSR